MKSKKAYITAYFVALFLIAGVGVGAKYGPGFVAATQVASTADALQAGTTPEPILVPIPETYTYLEVIGGCSLSVDESCVNAYSAPSATSTTVAKLRKGIVLRAEPVVSNDDSQWFQIVFDEWLRYPNRIATNWYVSDEYVRIFEDLGPQELLESTTATSTKYILIDRSEQKLYAYENDQLFMEQSISTGLQHTPTPRGVFEVYMKTPTRYMQGPLPGISAKYYDLPGVPWNLYFTKQGAVIHGAYWHEQFGKAWSNGCVNMPLDKAEELYYWTELGTPVIVQE